MVAYTDVTSRISVNPFKIIKVLLPLVTYVIVLLYLFRVQIPFWVQLLFSILCTWFALGYVIDLMKMISSYIHVSKNPYWINNNPWWNRPYLTPKKPSKSVISIIRFGFMSILFISNSLVMTDVIKINGAQDRVKKSEGDAEKC